MSKIRKKARSRTTISIVSVFSLILFAICSVSVVFAALKAQITGEVHIAYAVPQFTIKGKVTCAGEWGYLPDITNGTGVWRETDTTDDVLVEIARFPSDDAATVEAYNANDGSGIGLTDADYADISTHGGTYTPSTDLLTVDYSVNMLQGHYSVRVSFPDNSVEGSPRKYIYTHVALAYKKTVNGNVVSYEAYALDKVPNPYAEEIPDIYAGHRAISETSPLQPDKYGHIQDNINGQSSADFHDLIASDYYALRTTVVHIGGTEPDPGLTIAVRGSVAAGNVSTPEFQFSVLRNVARFYAGGTNWSSERIDIQHGMDHIFESGHEFSMLLYKGKMEFLLAIEYDREVKAVARISPEEIYVFNTESTIKTTAAMKAYLTAILTPDTEDQTTTNLIYFFMSRNSASGYYLNADYREYGWKTTSLSSSISPFPTGVDGSVFNPTNTTATNYIGTFTGSTDGDDQIELYNANEATKPDGTEASTYADVKNLLIPVGSRVEIVLTPPVINGTNKYIKQFLMYEQDTLHPDSAPTEINVFDNTAISYTGDVFSGITLSFVPAREDCHYYFKLEYGDVVSSTHQTTSMIIDYADDASLDGVRIDYYRVDGDTQTPIGRHVTDASGSAEKINFPNGSYVAKISLDNYHTREFAFTINDDTSDLGNIAIVKKLTGGSVKLGALEAKTALKALISKFDYSRLSSITNKADVYTLETAETNYGTADAPVRCTTADSSYLFTDVASEQVIIKYTADIEDLDTKYKNITNNPFTGDNSGWKETHPGIGLRIINPNGNSVLYKALRNGIAANDVSNHYGINPYYDVSYSAGTQPYRMPGSSGNGSLISSGNETEFTYSLSGKVITITYSKKNYTATVSDDGTTFTLDQVLASGESTKDGALHNVTFTRATAQLSRNLVEGSWTGSNGMSMDIFAFSNGDQPETNLGCKTTRQIDFMFIKSDNLIHMLMREHDPNLGNANTAAYKLIYSFAITLPAYRDVPLIYGIALSANSLYSCEITFKNMSITTDVTSVNNALAQYGITHYDTATGTGNWTTQFDFNISNSTTTHENGSKTVTFKNFQPLGYTNPTNVNEMVFRSGSTSRAFNSTQQFSGDYVVEATFQNKYYRNSFYGVESGVVWHGMGLAFGTRSLTSGSDANDITNYFMITQNDTSLRVGRTWDNYFATTANTAKTDAMMQDATIRNDYTLNGGSSAALRNSTSLNYHDNFGVAQTYKIKVIRDFSASTLYILRDDVYLGKIVAVNASTIEFYYANGTKSNLTAISTDGTDFAKVMYTVITSPKAILGVAAHGNDVERIACTGYNVYTDITADLANISKMTAATIKVTGDSVNELAKVDIQSNNTSLNAAGTTGINTSSSTTLTYQRPLKLVLTDYTGPNYTVRVTSNSAKLVITNTVTGAVIEEKNVTLDTVSDTVRSYVLTSDTIRQNYSYELQVTTTKTIWTATYKDRVVDYDSLNDGVPVGIEGVTVELNGNGIVRTATTDANGNFTITDLPAGTYTRVLSKPLSAGSAASNYYTNSDTLNITLTADGMTFDPVNVNTDRDKISLPKLKFKVVGGYTSVYYTNTDGKNPTDLIETVGSGFTSVITPSFSYADGVEKATVDTTSSNSGLNGYGLVFSEVKDPYSFVKYRFTRSGGNEAEIGLGFNVFDSEHKQRLIKNNSMQDGTATYTSTFSPTYIATGMRVSNPVYVKYYPSTVTYVKDGNGADTTTVDNWTKTHDLTTTNVSALTGSWDLAIIRNNMTYYFMVKNATSANYELALVTTEQEIYDKYTHLSSIADAVESGHQAMIHTYMTISGNIQATYSDFETEQGASVRRLVSETKHITGTLSATAAGKTISALGASKIVFTREDGSQYTGTVTANGSTVTYTADLPIGKYVKIEYQNYSWSNPYGLGYTITPLDSRNGSTVRNINFPSSSNVFINSGGTATTNNNGTVSTPMELQADGSLYAPAATGHVEAAMAKDGAAVTFVPNKQTATIGYTLTGMKAHSAAGGHPLIGMYVSSGRNNYWRSVITNAGDQMMMMVGSSFTSRTFYRDGDGNGDGSGDDAWLTMANPFYAYTFDQQTKEAGTLGYGSPYHLNVEYTIDGYDITLKMSVPYTTTASGIEANKWYYIFGGYGKDGQYRAPFNIYNWFNGGNTSGTADQSCDMDNCVHPDGGYYMPNRSNPDSNGSTKHFHLLREFLPYYYQLDAACTFGLSSRMDIVENNTNRPTFSNVYYRIEDKAATVSGKMTSSLEGFNTKPGNKIYFKDSTGKYHEGNVTGGGSGGELSYSAVLTAGTYTEAVYLNYSTSINLTVNSCADKTQALTFTSAKAYTSILNSDGLLIQDNGNLNVNSTKTRVDNADGTYSYTYPYNGNETDYKMNAATFTPSKQRLTFYFTIEGADADYAVGEYFMPGFFISSSGSNARILRSINSTTGLALLMTTRDQYQSRAYYSQSYGQSSSFAHVSGLKDYTFADGAANGDYVMHVKYVVEGYKISVAAYSPKAGPSSYTWIVGGDSPLPALDVYEYYNTPGFVSNAGPGAQLTKHASSLYDENVPCVFGITSRRDRPATIADEDNNTYTNRNARFTNISYVIEDL